MFCYTIYELVTLANIWSFLTVAGAIGTIIVFQKPIGNILANIMKVSQTSSSSSQQTPYAGPTNNPNPNAPTSTGTTPPSTEGITTLLVNVKHECSSILTVSIAINLLYL